MHPWCDIELRLLGGFDLRLSRVAVDVPQPARRLLALIALSRRPVSRVMAAGTLWPETTDAKACSNLRTALWRLNGLPRPPVRATLTTLTLDESVEVDVRGLENAAHALACGDPTFDIDALDPADVSRELLPEVWDAWLVFDRERLRQVALHALETLTLRLSAAGRHARAVAAGLAAVEMEPLRETSNRALVEAHVAEGNFAEAVRHYRRYADLLRRELDAQPSASFRALVAPAVPAG